MILGLDFMKEHKAQIDCGTLNIYLPELNVNIPGIEQKDASIKIIKGGEKSNKQKIKLVENEIIQAESTEIVKIKPKRGQLRGKFIFEPNRQWTDYTTTTIVEFSKDNTAHLPITNGNKHPLTINKLHILGTIEEISEGRIHEIEPTLDNIHNLGKPSVLT